MAKLYFKFGAMGCSKTAQALITKFNYEERGMKVMLMKPAVDNRDGESITRSRIGLSAPTLAVSQTEDLYALYKKIIPLATSSSWTNASFDARASGPTRTNRHRLQYPRALFRTCHGFYHAHVPGKQTLV